MRCVKFDKEVIRALEAMGFGVEEDNESASMEAVTVSVLHPAREECLHFYIELPCGDTLPFQLTPKRVLQIAWRANEEAMEHSHE